MLSAGSRSTNEIHQTATRIENHEEHDEHEDMKFDDLSSRVIGCAIEVHRELGPGLLESTYERFFGEFSGCSLNGD